MKDLLVGSTGFVGGNLMESHDFSMALHSRDIETGYDTRPQLAVYAGVPAAMFLANQDPAADLAVMAQARENIRRIAPRQLVLISSIAVYRDSRGKDEDSPMDKEGLAPYGANRLHLEEWVRQDFPEALIVRLPALYGKGLKKNFLYDLHTITPAMLRPDKYRELAEKSPLAGEGYELKENGFYCLNGKVSQEKLREFFSANDFNALAFTHSASRYQFYNLGRLWADINLALEAGLKLVNLTTPPVSAGQVYTAVTGQEWRNETAAAPYDYDLRTKHAALFGGAEGYLLSRDQELKDICNFMKDWK